jgi:adenylylsulfate kinase
MVIWLTGLSGAGKTTLGRAVVDLLSRVGPTVFLDGDAVRAAFADNLAYSESDRVIQIQRMSRLAGLIAGQGIAVVVAALYANDELLAWNRANLPGYVEVYLSAGIDTLAARDAKGLYGRALSGETQDVVGVDIPWHAPISPDLVLDVELRQPPEVWARRVVDLVPSIKARLGQPVEDGLR